VLAALSRLEKYSSGGSQVCSTNVPFCREQAGNRRWIASRNGRACATGAQVPPPLHTCSRIRAAGRSSVAPAPSDGDVCGGWRRPMARRASGSRKIGYAVAGLGHIAQTAVLPAFAHAKNSRLVALISDDEEKREKLSRKYRCDAYSYEQYEECLRRDDVDAVYIALPNTLHAEYTVR